MNLKLIESTAKESLEKQGHHAPMIIAMKPDKCIDMIILHFSTDKEKDMQLNMMRKKINKENIIKYWAIMEGWVGSDPFIRPSRDFERREAIIILEFDKKTMITKFVMLPFERKDDKIIWKERFYEDDMEKNANHFTSMWNFYKEDVSEEVLKKIKVESMYKKIDGISKDQMDEIVKKAREELNDASITKEKIKKEMKKQAKKMVFDDE